MIEASGTGTPERQSDERPDDRLNVISPRPAWAGETRIYPECIVHTWRSPITADGADTLHGDAFPIPVEVVQEDDLFMMPTGVTVQHGEPVIFLLDTNIKSTTEGRRLAAAILECCDRLDGAPQGA